MIKFRASIKVYKESRKTPFWSGYRPAFCFIRYAFTTSQITLLDKEIVYPGEEALAEISSITKEYLGLDFGVGSKFIFYEGRTPMGEGEVIEVLTPLNSRKKEMMDVLHSAMHDWPDDLSDFEIYEKKVKKFLGGKIAKNSLEETLSHIDFSTHYQEAASLSQLAEVFKFYKNASSLKEIVDDLNS